MERKENEIFLRPENTDLMKHSLFRTFNAGITGISQQSEHRVTMGKEYENFTVSNIKLFQSIVYTLIVQTWQEILGKEGITTVRSK